MSYDDPTENFIYLNESNVHLEVSFIGSGGNQTNFDTNEIYSFRLHRYSSLTNDDVSLPPMKKHIDKDIELVPCKD